MRRDVPRQSLFVALVQKFLATELLTLCREVGTVFYRQGRSRGGSRNFPTGADSSNRGLQYSFHGTIYAKNL